MQYMYRCVYTTVKIVICAIIAALISLLTWYLIFAFYHAPTPPPPPPPCIVDCQNGVCEIDRCHCPDNYTGVLCEVENFCRGFTDCTDQGCLTFGIILVGQYGYSEERCNATDVNANSPRATVQCRIENGTPKPGPIIPQNCNENLETLANKTDIAVDNAKEIAATTQILTSEPENLNSDDISNAIRIVNRILTVSTNASDEQEVVVSAVTTVSQILSAEPEQFSNEVVEKEAESLTMQMEAFSVNNNISSLSVVQPSVAVETRQLSTLNISGISFMSLRGFTDQLAPSRIIVDNSTSEFVLNETAEVQIFVKPVGELHGNGTVGFVLYQNDNLFPSKHEKKSGFRKKIISATISGATANVEFSFNQQRDPSYTLVQFACVSWDYEWSEWNTTGCEKNLTAFEDSSDSFTPLQCICHHTTNFAVLMKFKENINFASLNIVSVVGCALSVTGLTITVVFLLYTRSRKPVSWLLISSCSSLLIFYIVFIVAMEISEYTVVTENSEYNKSENLLFWSDLEKVYDGLCTGLAALQHYFLLVTFALMGLLGVELYFRIITASHYLPPRFMKIALITGWGVPAVIVSLTIAGTYPNQNTYNRREFCWLLAEDEENKFDFSKPMLWSFLLPVGMILIANICIVIGVVYTIWKKKEIESTRRLFFKEDVDHILSCFSIGNHLDNRIFDAHRDGR
ncbi:adhesion G-protein coupled receptor G7 isoform X1 [Engystomops pustulosus]|uniref:adhesion G-protein coupled receptor G7 isoform X1 n=1 Tax=Engystomops pustulosus TaxID=76066 RepID=UPI003AFAE461